MPRNLALIGLAMTYIDPDTGRYVVDTDSIEQPRGRTTDFGYNDDDDDFAGVDDDYDNFAGDDDEEFGRRSGRRARRRSRQDLNRDQKRDRQDLRRDTRRDRQDERGARRGNVATDNSLGGPGDEAPNGWGSTIVAGSETLGDAGSATIRIRLQHDFIADDLTLTGSTAGAKVNTIFFGDRSVWSNPDGIDASVFAVGGFMRGLLKGQKIGRGVDITISGSLPGAGTFTAAITGKKPLSYC